MQKTQINATTIKAIESVLSKGDKVEVIPAPDGGVKVIRLQRKIILDTSKNK